MDPLFAFAKLAPAVEARDWRGVSFTDFVRQLGVELTPGQEVLALVAYDGLDPCDLPTEEQRDLARDIFGPVDRIPPEARRVVVAVAGARAGKTYAIGALRCLHLALTCPLTTLAPGEEAVAAIIAPDPRQRKQAYNYVLGAARRSPSIAATIEGEPGKESFRLRRPDGVVLVESVPAKRGGSAGRGRSLVCAVLEEAAFFLDENHVVNDVEVFRGVQPRVLTGGQTIISSTPWAEAGLLYTEFVANHPAPRCAAPHLVEPGTPHRAIAAHAPTLLLRDVEETRGIVAAEERRDQANAAREYGAQFMSAGTAQLFSGASILSATDRTLMLGSPASECSVVVVGADLGFVNDASVGAAVERGADGYRLLDYREQLPTPGAPLKPSQVFANLVGTAKRVGAQEVVGDQHYAESAREAFHDAGLVFIPAASGQQGKAEMFAELRRVLEECQLRLPADERLLSQLRDVRRRPLPGGGYAIEQTRTRGGGHGDIVAALVAAVWRLRLARIPERPEAMPEDPLELEAELWRRQRAERREQEARAAEKGDVWAYAPIRPID